MCSCKYTATCIQLNVYRACKIHRCLNCLAPLLNYQEKLNNLDDALQYHVLVVHKML